MNYISLSKLMSYILRHHPEEFGIELDKNGFVPMRKLARKINDTGRFDRRITPDDFAHVIENGDNRRFEIQGDKIRAMYGHSTKQVVQQTPAEPPELLYHGTPWKNVTPILREGLKPMKRQYVHCSPTPEWAKRVGSRRDPNPAILIVEAKRAYEAGVPFYTCNDQIWLSGAIPPEFLRLN